ncbi:MAG: hypothetical protein ACYC7E_06930 [Armatimonadota bacterium]
MRTWLLLAIVTMSLIPACCWAGETKITLREHLKQQWTNELLTYPFSAAQGACDARSVTLTGPQGAVPVQLSEITYWPGGRWVKSAKLSYIASLSPLAADLYTVRYGKKPVPPNPNATDLQVVAGKEQVEITTKQFGARLPLGEQTYAAPVAAAQVPAPVIAMRLADGTWYGGSRMYGAGKLKAFSAKLTESGPVFARVAFRYTYENGNTLDLTVQVAAGDNTMRMETLVAKDQPKDGFNLVLSRGLPPFIFQVQDEARKDRPSFTKDGTTGFKSEWAEIPLKDYIAPKPQPANLVTRLTPWEDWFGTFTQRTIRLKLENTTRELQIHSLDPGAWVEPRDIREIFGVNSDPDPAKDLWVGWNQKMMPLLRDTIGDIYLQVNAARGVRKWLVSECQSVIGWKGMGEGPTPESRPTLGCRLDEVKDFVLDWPGDAGTHPRLWLKKAELTAVWNRKDADPDILAELIRSGAAGSPESVPSVAQSGGSNHTALGAYLYSGGSLEVAQKTQMLARLYKALQASPNSLMFSGGQVSSIYDALIDSPVVPDAERSLLRAQMANLAYGMADPATWSAERGYCSGNSNMTVNYVLGLGMIACTIPEHPKAKAWYRNADLMMEQFLGTMVGPDGEWPEAMGHHGLISVAAILAFGVASTNTGFHDYVNDPRMKRLMLYQAKLHTPRDPRPRGPVYTDAKFISDRRYMPAMGRDSFSADQNWALSGVMARATAKSDPAYSSALQWLWLQSGPRCYQTGYKMGGFEYVYCDRSLPAKTPTWTSDAFPRAGAVLRQGLDTPDEHQVMLYSGDHSHAFYPCHAGSFPSIFAFGKPIAGCFAGGYDYQERFLTCHVDLAATVGTLAERTAVVGYDGGNRPGESMWSWPEAGATAARFAEQAGLSNMSAFSTLPRQDYVAVDVALKTPRRMELDWRKNLPAWPPVPQAGKPPVDWRRQTLFLKDDDPAKATYLLIRDSVKGGQPTMWQMWTLSEMLDTPEKVKDVTAVLANKPGYKILPARELTGNRFTAIGQQGVDVEYYIASPSATPRYTLRWGAEKYDWSNKHKEPEYQDLLHLQMPGDGTYYVAFFPRKRNTPAPAFSTLGDGTIIKAEGDFGKDYGFLSALEATATGEGASFTGTAASVQDRPDGLVLSLGAKGAVRYQTVGLAADFPASLRVRGKELIVEVPASLQAPAFGRAQTFPGGTLTLTAPGEWALVKPLNGVTLLKTAAGWTLTVPAGVRAVALTSPLGGEPNK